MRWEVLDQDVESVEEILLPVGAHFQEDAKNVIRCWKSTDVSACPGSGKTTVLLAKLKLLADRMPFIEGAGICVLSHTNIAVDEIKSRLSDYADKLISYPNYIGTIQSFIDKFVTMPYLREVAGRNIQTVDDLTYAQHMQNKMQNNVVRYKSLLSIIRRNCNGNGQYQSMLDYIRALHLDSNGSLFVGNQKKALAGAGKDSSIQYCTLMDDILKQDGIIRYNDAYSHAMEAIHALPITYTELFSARFQYVFVDEYQDCNEIQRQVIDALFSPAKCTVIKIGDPDQAIYNSSKVNMPDWAPQDGFLPIMMSCRYSQEIADVICKLKKNNDSITTVSGQSGIKPVLFVFGPENIDQVIGSYIKELERHGLYDNNGIYKAVGAVRNENATGLRIGSYWAGFDASPKTKNEHNYWTLIDGITESLSEGKLYSAERLIRKLICRVFHYLKIRCSETDKDYTLSTIRTLLNSRYSDLYRQQIYEISGMQNFERESVGNLIECLIKELLKAELPNKDNAFNSLPSYFMEQNANASSSVTSEKNVFIDPIRGRRIMFDTIHGVKGETHDATLYLETDRQGASDLSRILPYFGIGKLGKSDLYDYSRKLAYVGMSRPRKLLCVAMQAKTYEKCKDVFANTWDIVDLRGKS